MKHTSNTTTTRINNSANLKLLDLPEEILTRVTGFLDAPELLRIRLVNQYLASLAARNDAGWKTLCDRLWSDKAHVCSEAWALRNEQHGNDNNQRNCMEAYRVSLHDATARHYLRLHEEFLYDPVTQQGTVWSFRFKQAAGTDWTLSDPWYQGRPARQMVFLADGTCQQYHGNGRVGHMRWRPNNAADDNHTQQHQPLNEPNAEPHINDNNQVNNNIASIPMTWRWLTRPMDLPTRHLGSYVRITVGGRDVPTYSVRRSPAGNWGFVMESCWGLFASFPLPSKQPPSPSPQVNHPEQLGPPSRDPQAAMPALRRRLRRVSNGTTRWVWVATNNGDEDDDEVMEDVEEGHAPQIQRRPRRRPIHANSSSNVHHDPWATLRDDTHLLISNEIQWREAFLYNVGSRVLPEGDEARNVFDRAWGGHGGGGRVI